MRLALLKLSWLLAALIAGGCMSPITAEENEPGGDDVVIERDENESPAGNAISFSMNAEQFASLATWLGKSNSVVFEKPFHVEVDGTTIDAKAGTKFDYELGDGTGKITFAKPFPTVKAGFAKLIGGVSLHALDLKSDGTGTASTGLGRYKIRWAADEESGAASPNELPEVWAYSMAGCPPCARAKSEIAEAKDLPFRVVWKDEAAPSWLASRPAFWWHVSGQHPSQDDVNNTRQVTGWNGLRDFTERWKASRSPKRFQRSAAASSGATNYHSGHDCPRCGREQYAIKNHAGPVASSHTHQCGSCGTSWFHRDQN